MIPIGFSLQPDEVFVELCRGELRDEFDYVEIAPETTWRVTADGALIENGFHAQFLDVIAATGKPCVAHGVGLSMGSARPDPARRALWLERMRCDQELFHYRWYTDHLGATELDGRQLVLPLPLPRTRAASERVAQTLRAMRTIVPEVGFENSAFYFHLGKPLDEPRWIADTLALADAHLLLDLHNLHTNAFNAGFDAREYVDRLPLERVIEVHLSGGGWSDPRWLPSGRTQRLDGHDDAVPEEVWKLFEHVLPRLANVRGITLERMESTVASGDVPLLREELRRARRMTELVHGR